ncbi:MAG TPA: hypothetical protein VJ725_30225 [Thermoanaerobaculia bacterium]|nr:hypothetical protein [Thermoanaerobaculia bacterium]
MRVDHVTVEIRGTDPAQPPSQGSDPVMARLAAERPDLADEMSALLPELRRCEDRLFGFLDERPENGAAYLADPIGTLESVCGLPVETAGRMRALSEREVQSGRAS